MCESSSSDNSDFCDRFKNIRSLLVNSQERRRDLDENYAYKQKLGDLIFDADFEGGNLGSVEQVDLYDYDLMARPDVTNPRHRIWFNFTVANQRANQCVVFTFVNLSENLSLFNEGLTPVVRSRDKPNWVRLNSNQVFYYRSINHNNRLVLSIAFRFANLHDDQHQFALFYPYSITNLSEFVYRWSTELKRKDSKGSTGEEQKRVFDVARASVNCICTSVLNKPIYEIGVTSGDSAASRLVAIVVGRTSGCFESASYFVCQGVLDFILSDHFVAKSARKFVNLVVFPMLDPDSSWVGNGRTDLMGQRNIDRKLVDANPSLYQAWRLTHDHIENICAKTESNQRVIIVELQVNSDLIGARVIGRRYRDSLRMSRHMHFPRLLYRFSQSFYLENCSFIDSSQGSRPTDNLFDFSAFDLADQYQLEVSPLGYHKRKLSSTTYETFDQKKYLLLGRSLVYSLLELVRSKHDSLPHEVSHHLASFSPSSRDVDDLVLVRTV